MNSLHFSEPATAENTESASESHRHAVVVYQRERRWLVVGWKPPVEGGEWMNSDGQSCESIDHSRTRVVSGNDFDWQPVHQEGRTDPNGWRYGPTPIFPENTELASSGSSEEADCWTRWRVWTCGWGVAEQAPAAAAEVNSAQAGGEIEELWQNQRWWMGLGWAPTDPVSGALNGDPAPWTVPCANDDNALGTELPSGVEVEPSTLWHGSRAPPT